MQFRICRQPDVSVRSFLSEDAIARLDPFGPCAIRCDVFFGPGVGSNRAGGRRLALQCLLASLVDRPDPALHVGRLFPGILPARSLTKRSRGRTPIMSASATVLVIILGIVLLASALGVYLAV